MAQTAIENGATVLNYAKVIKLKKDANGKLNGVIFQDTPKPVKNLKRKQKVIVNATGVLQTILIKWITELTTKPLAQVKVCIL